MAGAHSGPDNADELDLVDRGDVLASRAKPLGDHRMTDKLLRTDEIQTEAWRSEPENGSLDLKRIHERSAAPWRLAWNHRRFLLRVTGIGLACSLATAFLIPTRYRSTVRLMPPDQGSSGMGMAMLAAATGGAAGMTGQMGSSLGSLAGDMLGMKNSSDLFVGILGSHNMQDDLINKFNLRKEYHDRKIEDARDDLDKRTDFTADRKSGIIKIEVTDHDPKKAAAMAGEYVDRLNEVVAHLNTSAAHRERIFLEDRLVQVKADLESSEKNFSTFASKNTTIDIQSQAKAMIESGAELQGQLIATQTELQGLRQIYSDNNVRIRTMQARVDEIKRQLQKIVGQREDASAQVQGDPPDDTLYPSIRKLPIIGVSYADLYRDSRVEEAIFEVLTKEYELAKVQEAKETPSVKVLDVPDVPEKKSFPPRIVITVLGTILALAGALLFVFGQTRWEAVEDSDARKALAIEVYSTVRARMTKGSTNGSSTNGSNASHLESHP
jgi:capsule polysaccharide export protein KpsE/RkpR